MRDSKRDTDIEQSFGPCGRGRGWDGLGEWHWNMYIIICEMNRQSRFDAWDRVLGAGALGRPWGMEGGGRWEGGSGWGTRVHPWQIHVNVWQNQYNIVISLQKKKKNVFLIIPTLHLPFALLLFNEYTVKFSRGYVIYDIALGWMQEYIED